ITMLPQHVKAALQQHLLDVQHLHTQDLATGGGSVYLPYALERKYPKAHYEWVWQYVCPAARLSRDPRTSSVRRHHMHKLVLQRAVHAAVRKANIAKPASCHTLRHAFATRLLDESIAALFLHRNIPEAFDTKEIVSDTQLRRTPDEVSQREIFS